MRCLNLLFTGLFLLFFSSLSAQNEVCYDTFNNQGNSNGDPTNFCLSSANEISTNCGYNFVYAPFELEDDYVANIHGNYNYMMKIPAGVSNEVTLEFTFVQEYDFFGNPVGGPNLHDEVHISYEDFFQFVDLEIEYEEVAFGGTVTYRATFPIEREDPVIDDDPSSLILITFYAPQPIIGQEPTEVKHQFVTNVVPTGALIVSDPTWVAQSPPTVQTILRDPPGGGSYAEMTSTTENCHGYGVSVANTNAVGGWASVQVGASGSAGFLVETDYSAYASLSVGLEVGLFRTSANEYKMCYTATNTVRTDNNNGTLTGSAGDIYLGTSIPYAYGIYNTVYMDGCLPRIKKDLVLAPNETLNTVQSFSHTEYHILNDIIPGLEDDINNLPDGDAKTLKINELEMWEQAIQLNHQIRADAIANQVPDETKVFSPEVEATYTNSITTSEIRNTEMNLYIEAEVAFEVGATVNNTGGTLGAKIRTRIERGSTMNASNESTNNISANLIDESAGDNFTVHIYKDLAFGTPIYALDEIASETSCPYEGGYQIDQPVLLAEDGTQTVTLENIPVGTDGFFRLRLCNDSEDDRTYKLEIKAGTNPDAVIEGPEGIVAGNGQGANFTIPAGECLEDRLYKITQLDSEILVYEGIELFLYTACQPSSVPIESVVVLDAFFGNSTSVDEADLDQMSLNVIPNPNNGQFQVDLEEIAEDGLLSLMDISGRTILQQEIQAGTPKINLEATHLLSGVYWLSFLNDQRRIVQKLIIE